MRYFAAVQVLAGIMCLECFFLARRITWRPYRTINTRAGAVTFCTSLEVNSIRGIRLKNLRSSFSDWISLSQHDDLTLLQSWSPEQSSAWYSKPVPHRLSTNSVWTSLLTERSVKHHGPFHVFQSASDEHAAAGLIPRAKALGYWTVSVLPDQLTWWVGSKLPFNENKSGPSDWRQLAISL